jgi:hypothetical protein
MVFYRLLHSYHWSKKKRRYVRTGFQLYGAGVSIVCKPCTKWRSDFQSEKCSIRLQRFYPSKPNNILTVLWELDSDLFGDGFGFVHSLSSTGDLCHHDITGFTPESAGDFIGEKMESEVDSLILWICRPGQELQRTSLAELSALL